MIDYRKNKCRYKPNKLGSLYIDQDKMKNSIRPIIYIGGQMEHRGHILEQFGKTFDNGHNMFDGSWFYDYPIFKSDKRQINAEAFANNLIEALKLANILDVDLVTESFGGIIGAYASKSNIIHRVYAIHPPILGTPLANPKELINAKKFTLLKDKLLLLILKLIVNENYGFEIDNFNGINITKVNINKLIVIGSNINPAEEKSKLIIMLYNIILKYTGYQSDGIVIFDEEKFNELGINYIKEDNNINHLEANSRENLSKVKKLVNY